MDGGIAHDAERCASAGSERSVTFSHISDLDYLRVQIVTLHAASTRQPAPAQAGRSRPPGNRILSLT